MKPVLENADGFASSSNLTLPVYRGGIGGVSLYLQSDFLFTCHHLKKLVSRIPYTNFTNLDRVLIHVVFFVNHMLNVMSKLDAEMAKSNIKLIIVGSIASMFRGI